MVDFNVKKTVVKIVKCRMTPVLEGIHVQMLPPKAVGVGLVMPDSANPMNQQMYRSHIAYVLSVGPETKTVKKGDFVVMVMGSTMNVVDFGDFRDTKDGVLLVITESQIGGIMSNKDFKEFRDDLTLDFSEAG